MYADCISQAQISWAITFVVLYPLIIFFGRKHRHLRFPYLAPSASSHSASSSDSPTQLLVPAPLAASQSDFLVPIDPSITTPVSAPVPALSPAPSPAPAPPTAPVVSFAAFIAPVFGTAELSPKVKCILRQQETASFVIFGLSWVLNFFLLFSYWTWGVGVTNLIFSSFCLYGLIVRHIPLTGTYATLTIFKALFHLLGGIYICLLAIGHDMSRNGEREQPFDECTDGHLQTFYLLGTPFIGLALAITESIYGWLRFSALREARAAWTVEQENEPTFVVIPHSVLASQGPVVGPSPML